MLLTVPQAAKRLNLGVSTVYELCHTDPTFPAYWVHDHCVRVVEAKLPEWIDGRLAQRRQKEVAHG